MELTQLVLLDLTRLVLIDAAGAGAGTKRAVVHAMTGVHRHEELEAWQLASRLSDRIHALLERLPCSKDRTFCEELLEASEAIPANIAEGFDRFTPRQFHYFLQIAKGSLGETTSRIRNGYTRHYWTVDEFNELLLLARRTRGATTGLILSCEKRIAESERRHLRKRRTR